MTVTPAKGKRKSVGATGFAALTEPKRIVPSTGVTIRMPGIGGTGVVTISQILLAAAKIDGLKASAVDQTGLSQKAGPVVSTVEMGEASPGQVDLLLAFDLLTAINPANVEGLDPKWSHVVASTTVTPTGRMIGHVASSALDIAPYRADLDSRSEGASNRYVDSAKLTIGLLGSALTSNVFLLGVALQAGMLPLSSSAIERAIELNGVAVEANREAFAWGRRWAVDPDAVEKAARGTKIKPADRKGLEDLGTEALIEFVASRRVDLRAYQDAKYADRYVAMVRRCAAAEQTAGTDGSFTFTVAQQLFRVMAYKDEYEVARLLSDGKARAEDALGGPIESMTWNLHPPSLRAAGMKSKLKLGPWSKPGLALLAKGKRLRGTAADPFGRSAMRQTERQLIGEYTALVESLLSTLPTDASRAVHIAGLIDKVRGYESVKERNLKIYRTELETALKEK